MENTIFTLHEFMLHTKNIIYILMGVSIILIGAFWRFLSERDNDNIDSKF